MEGTGRSCCPAQGRDRCGRRLGCRLRASRDDERLRRARLNDDVVLFTLATRQARVPRSAHWAERSRRPTRRRSTRREPLRVDQVGVQRRTAVVHHRRAPDADHPHDNHRGFLRRPRVDDADHSHDHNHRQPALVTRKPMLPSSVCVMPKRKDELDRRDASASTSRPTSPGGAIPRLRRRAGGLPHELRDELPLWAEDGDARSADDLPNLVGSTLYTGSKHQIMTDYGTVTRSGRGRSRWTTRTASSSNRSSVDRRVPTRMTVVLGNVYGVGNGQVVPGIRIGSTRSTADPDRVLGRDERRLAASLTTACRTA